MDKIKRLFTIKTKFEAFLAIYAIALGACERGIVYMEQYPGVGGKLLFGACILAVFVTGNFLIDGVALKQLHEG